MAQFYTLEEAARVLGMSAEELKTKAQSREVRAFLDGGIVAIPGRRRRRAGPPARAGERRRAAALRPRRPGGQSGSGEVQDLDLSEFQLGVAKPRPGSRVGSSISKVESPGDDSGSDHDILLDDLSLPPSPITGSSSVIIGAPCVGQAPQRFRRPARARHGEGRQRLRRAARVAQPSSSRAIPT